MIREAFSLSIFTIEADRKPILAFAVKKYEDADTFFRNEHVRAKLGSTKSGGFPLADDLSILRLRLANAEERARYMQKMTEGPTRATLASVFLIDIDPQDTA